MIRGNDIRQINYAPKNTLITYRAVLTLQHAPIYRWLDGGKFSDALLVHHGSTYRLDHRRNDHRIVSCSSPRFVRENPLAFRFNIEVLICL